MKLSQLKQQLIEKNNRLPEKARRVSSVSGSFEKVQKHEDLKMKDNPLIGQVQKELVNTYNKTDGIIPINQINPIDITGRIENVEELTAYSGVDINKIKIIGITGSKGKSTTSFVVHEYIKSLGYKSILYSSIRIDSPVSFINKNESCEIPLKDENMLLNIIEEAETYGADYLVLEINDIAIDKGLTNGIPFNIRALTNLIPNHNEEVYTPERYCQIKKSFFENIPGDEECTCVFGLTGSLSRDEFNELLRLNNNPKKTFGSKYICERRNADYTNLDCLLSEVPNMPLDSLDGLSMRIRVGNKTHDFFSNIILPHNALNFTSAVAILDALKIFDANSFSECIKDIKVPGREDVIKVNDRAIVIGLSIIPSLEVFKKYKNNYQTVNKIKVVIGAVGTGFVGWDKEFTSERFLNERSNFRRYAMNYVKENADFAYLTSNDNAADNPLDIALELQSYLNNEIPSVIETDRYEAIRKAIIESNPKDIIFIGGRGNRRILCDTANTVKFILDKEVVEKVLHELEWDY